MTTTVVTGSASGIGAAVRARFQEAGDTVIGIDIRDAEIIADLSTREGREAAIAAVRQRCDGLDRFVACAGLATDAGRPALIASVNYFGAIELLDELFELLQRGSNPSAVLILSNSARWGEDDTPFVQALLDHDEARAARVLEEMEEITLALGTAYIGSKLAMGRALRRRAPEWG